MQAFIASANSPSKPRAQTNPAHVTPLKIENLGSKAKQTQRIFESRSESNNSIVVSAVHQYEQGSKLHNMGPSM